MNNLLKWVSFNKKKLKLITMHCTNSNREAAVLQSLMQLIVIVLVFAVKEKNISLITFRDPWKHSTSRYPFHRLRILLLLNSFIITFFDISNISISNDYVTQHPVTILNDDPKKLLVINSTLPQKICVLPIVVFQAHDHFLLLSLPSSPINTLTCHLEWFWQFF